MSTRVDEQSRAIRPLENAQSTTELNPEIWELRLYVAGHTAKSAAAIENLQRICDEHLEGRYKIEVVDLVQQPQLARADQIVALPTLVRKLPNPVRKIIGDLSNTEKTLVGLQIRPAVSNEK